MHGRRVVGGTLAGVLLLLTGCGAKPTAPGDQSTTVTPAHAAAGQAPTAPAPRLAVRKNADDVALCQLFTGDDLARVLGSVPEQPPSGPYCTVTAHQAGHPDQRLIVVTVDSASLADYRSRPSAKPTTVGGNPAHTYPSENGGCVVATVLSTDPSALAPVLQVTLDPITGDIPSAETCPLARSVSELVFGRLPVSR